MCFGRCPEWIAAEGDILPTTPATLRKALDANPDIRVLLVNSAGGSVEAAIAMAQLLRSRRMNVMVAATVAVDCKRFGLSCGPGIPEYAEPLRGDCESACIPLLAGGVQRGAWPDASLRVHRYRQARYERTKRGSGIAVKLGPELFSKADYAPTATHLKAMGISDDIIQLIRRTPVFPMAWIDPDLAIRSRLINVEHGRTLFSNWERRTPTVDGVPIVARLSLKYSAQPQTYFRFIAKPAGYAETSAFVIDSLGVLKPDPMELRFGSITIPNVAGAGAKDAPTVALTEV
ncbi:hypothetical protein WDZ92_36510, partial [Nostoc sp. NIES-2111]